jgi:hypothetical protein
MVFTVFSNITFAEYGYDELSFSFVFKQPSLSHKVISDQQFAAISIPGCMAIGRSDGAPLIPVKFVNVLVPYGYQVLSIDVNTDTIEVDTSDYNLKDHPIVPYQKSVPIGYEKRFENVLDFILSFRDFILFKIFNRQTSNDDNRPFEDNLDFNTSIYESVKNYPEAIVENQGVHFSRGYSVLSIAMNPIQYQPKDGQLMFHSAIDIVIRLEPTQKRNDLFRNNINDKQWVERLVINPEQTQSYKQSSLSFGYPGGICDPSDNYDYVIITTTQNSLDHWVTDSTTPYNWTSLMNKHQIDDGLDCTLVTVEDISAESVYWNSTPLFNDSEAHIREFCKDAYQDWGTDYILIGADAEWISRRQLYYSYEGGVDSDLYWSNLDSTFNEDGDTLWGESGDGGFDLYSEIFIGSLTCDVPQDVSNWMTKSFYYADASFQDYLENAAFYGGDTGWSCQGDDFIDYSAIQGTDDWLGPIPHSDGPFPTWAGFQFGFETWNSHNIGQEFNMTVMWTAESPNPGGWQGGSESAAIDGLKNDINNDNVTVISAIAHANEHMSMDVYDSSWEANYHNTKPFFIHDYGCHCGDLDAADDGVLHSMLFHSDTELAFACVYNTGYGWGNFDSTNSSSSFQQKSFWDYLFDISNHSGSSMNWQMGKAQAWSKDFMAPTIDWDAGSQTWRGIIESCLLFGDPAQRLKPPVKPDHNIGIQTFDVSSHEPHNTNILIETTLYNNGKNNESNIYVSYRVNGTEVDNDIISFFEKDTFEIVNWQYTTPNQGWNYLSVNVTQITGETILADNEKIKQVIYGPDIAVTAIQAPDMMGQGNQEEVKGLIKNLGPTDENSIQIQLIANGIISDSTTISLTSGSSTWVTFLWDATTSGIGVYPVKIYTVPVSGESYLANQAMEHMVTVGNITTIFTDNFETDQGWTIDNSPSLTTGAWERGTPIGGGDRGDPATDYDGSGQCFVTDNRDGDYDIDDGTTWLISPTIALDPTMDAIIEYAIWYSNDYGADPNNDLFHTYVSNDSGFTWHLAETIGPQSLSGWNERSFLVGDVITSSSQFRIRFEASDLNSGSVVEAGIDAFQASTFDYNQALGPILSINPLSYNFGAMQPNQTASNTFEIWNSGTNTLAYTLNENCSWLSVTPLQGNSTGEYDNITFTVNTTGLQFGTYRRDIHITSNGGNMRFNVALFVMSDDSTLLTINTGWNLITMPVQTGWYASDLADNITGSLSVSRWDNVNQTYRTYIVGGPPVFDFPIKDGCGYFVDTDQSSLLIVNGTPVINVSINLKIGWNLIGWYHDYNTTASSIGSNITGCLSVSRWDKVNQTYQTYIIGGPPVFDFTVKCGMGLFVDVSQESTWHGEG